MDPFEMVVLIVLIVTIGSIFKHRARASHRFKDLEEEMGELNAVFGDDGSGAGWAEGGNKLKKRVAELEERVKTLERIVTDKSDRLSREIDSL